MKNVIKDAEGKLSSIVEKLSEEMLKESQATKTDTPLIDVSKLLSEKGVKHPNINSVFFNSTIYEQNLWEDNKIFVGFALLIALSALVFYECFEFMSDKQFPSGYLLFFFGVIAIMFVGLVVVALFMIKALAKHHADKNERKNKMLAFRLKMLETAFDLENRNIIAEKLCIEKGLLMKEKDYLYSLDEKQRMAEHDRKIQLKQFEILEDYMEHMAELAKTGQQNTWNIDLLRIISSINKKEQPTEDKTQEPQAASTGSDAQKEKESAPVEENPVDETATGGVDPEKQTENQEPKIV